jgi:hypothetical protein
VHPKHEFSTKTNAQTLDTTSKKRNTSCSNNKKEEEKSSNFEVYEAARGLGLVQAVQSGVEPAEAVRVVRHHLLFSMNYIRK